MQTPPTPERRAQPLLIVHTGKGKGKTTAALGLLLNVPRRRALEAATPLMPTDTAAPANGAAFRSTF